MICHNFFSLINYINKVTGPYDVNSFAITAALAALKDKSYIDNYVLEVKKAREWILNKFKSTKIRTHFSGGNYFLIWPKKDPKITNRYSILVKQYIISSEAYNFYKTLKTLSSNGSLLSQVQPGFIVGNITNTNNPEEKVVGFFEVSTVSEKRIFFNFDDIFPNETSSSYFYDCGIQDYTSLVDFPSPNSPLFGGRVDLFYFIRNNEIVYYDHHPTSGLYLMVYSYCGDCTSFSSNIQPDFWQ